MNRHGSISITQPTTGTTITQGAKLAIQADSIDIDGTATEVRFYANELLIGTDDVAPWEIVWMPDAGSYTLSAVAVDNDEVHSPASELVAVLIVKPNATGTVTPTPTQKPAQPPAATPTITPTPTQKPTALPVYLPLFVGSND